MPNRDLIKTLIQKFGNLSDAPPQPLTINKKNLVNRFNLLHFRQKPLKLVFESSVATDVLKLEAVPQPYAEDYLVCRWCRPVGSLSASDFMYIELPDRDYAIAVRPVVKKISHREIQFELVAEFVYEKLYYAIAEARFKQKNSEIRGQLVTFDLSRLYVVIDESSLSDLNTIDPGSNIDLTIFNDQKYVFDSRFNLSKMIPYQSSVLISILPSFNQLPLAKPRKCRSKRVQLKPMPEVSYRHPFHQKPTRLNVVNLSGSGLLAENCQGDASLFAGLVIPDLELIFSGNIRIKGCARVVHRTLVAENKSIAKAFYGLAFLEMKSGPHTLLQAIVQQTENPDIRIDEQVDMDELWNFFFETGFVYPSKYQNMATKRKMVEKTYATLYRNSPNFARHFTYRKGERILGHISMLRFNVNAWIIHHHAALKSERVKAGLAVLEQASQFIHNCHWNKDYHMDYLICYFRPENAFPAYFFGDYASALEDVGCCSTDTFSYHSFKKTKQSSGLRIPWRLRRLETSDLSILNAFYSTHSGGLLLDAFDLKESSAGPGHLFAEYHRAGLKKERHHYALVKGSVLKAVFIVNVADELLNMSDLVNCISVIVTDASEVSAQIMEATLHMLSGYYQNDSISFLVYPEEFATQCDIPVQKKYVLWIIKTNCTDSYLQYFNRLVGHLSQSRKKPSTDP